MEMDDYMWNPYTCDSKCNKPGETGEYLDIKNCEISKTTKRT